MSNSSETQVLYSSINNVELKSEPNTIAPIDEMATPSTQQLAEASNRIHNRYAKTFQRLAKE